VPVSFLKVLTLHIHAGTIAPIGQRTRITPKVAPIFVAMRTPREVIQLRWGVYLLKRKAERFPFTVAGRNPQEALERAVKEYDIPERERRRISAQGEACRISGDNPRDGSDSVPSS
jgi:hypothetical protein